MLNFFINKQSNVKACVPLINKFYQFSKYNFNENNKTLNKLVRMSMQNEQYKNLNANVNTNKNFYRNKNIEEHPNHTNNYSYYRPKNPRNNYEDNSRGMNVNSNRQTGYGNYGQGNLSMANHGNFFIENNNMTDNRRKNDWNSFQRNVPFEKDFRAKPFNKYTNQEGSYDGLDNSENKSGNFLKNNKTYEEKDISIDPRAKSEDLETYFLKNQYGDNALFRSLKLRKSKIFDQEFDINKCEIIDLDKKTNETIVNMIFEKKADKKYFDHLNTMTEEGFVIDDNDLDCPELKEFKIKSPTCNDDGEAKSTKKKASKSDSTKKQNDKKNGLTNNDKGNEIKIIDITAETNSKGAKKSAKAKGSKVTKTQDGVKTKAKKEEIGKEEENEDQTKKKANTSRSKSNSKVTPEKKATPIKTKTAKDLKEDQTPSKTNKKSSNKTIKKVEKPKESELGSKQKIKESKPKSKNSGKTITNPISNALALKKNIQIDLSKNLKNESNFINYLEGLQLKSFKDKLFKEDTNEFFKNLFFKLNKINENLKLKKERNAKPTNNMDLDAYLFLKNYQIWSSCGQIRIKYRSLILFKFSLHFQHILSKIRKLEGNKINNFYSYKFDKADKKGYSCFMIFSEDSHMGTIICNFGHLDNLRSLESIVNLFNLCLVEVVETHIKEKIYFFNMISDKDLNFNNFLNKTPLKGKSGLISSTVKKIMDAKLHKFKINNEGEPANKCVIAANDVKKDLIEQEDGKQITVPNVNFEKKQVFKKSFAKYFEIAAGLKEGEIIYKF